jgi:hypothetical protein
MFVTLTLQTLEDPLQLQLTPDQLFGLQARLPSKTSTAIPSPSFNPSGSMLLMLPKLLPAQAAATGGNMTAAAAQANPTTATLKPSGQFECWPF